VRDCSTLTGEFRVLNRDGATHYFELGFAPEAGSILPYGGSSGDIKILIRTEPLAEYDQSNDYSFTDQAASAYIEWEKVTLYRAGVLVAGVEPP
jgi:hypothetical protein